ncbi:MAG TPA: ABC transporter permease [Alphaproteobacteria bacterium]|nr:ABC transporter permease [Alphaproteobacteria bacterium]
MMRAFNAAMIALMLAPIVLVVWMSFTPEAFFRVPLDSFSLRWYREALSYPDFVDAFVLSAKLAALAALMATALSFLAAYGLVRYRLAGRGFLLGFFTSPLVVPAVVFGIAMLQFVNRIGLYNHLVGLLFAHVVVVTPYAIRTLHATLQAVPEEMEWAAMVLGATRLRMLARVTVPLAARGIATAFLFCFLLSFSEVTMTIFMTGPALQTLPVRIYNYLTDRIDPTVAAVSSLVVLVSLCLVFLANLAGAFKRLPR